jgi:hypothetical protein
MSCGMVFGNRDTQWHLVWGNIPPSAGLFGLLELLAVISRTVPYTINLGE